MKKQIWSIAFFAALMAIPFAACVKDPVEPTAKQKGIWIGLGKVFNSCSNGSFICIRRDKDFYENMLLQRPNTDEVATLPVAQADGSILITGKMKGENLSERVRSLLLERRLLEVAEDVVLGEDLLRTAYENAGLTYNGQQVNISKGTYQVEVEETGGSGTSEQRKIVITIKVKGVTIIITIEW